MSVNVSVWLRQFRPAFQRQFIVQPGADIELVDLLRAADERRGARSGGPDADPSSRLSCGRGKPAVD